MNISCRTIIRREKGIIPQNIPNIYEISSDAANFLFTEDIIYSKNHKFRLVMQPDGNLVEFDENNNQIWESSTSNQGTPHQNYLVMQGDGNLVMHDNHANYIWNTNVYFFGTRPFTLSIEDNGNIVIRDSKRLITWQSFPSSTLVSNGYYFLHNGKNLVSPQKKFKLFMQGDGNLVLYGEKGLVFWASNTVHQGVYNGSGNYLVMQDNGDLVMYDANKQVIWSSESKNKGTGPFTFSVLDNGRIVIEDKNNKRIWEA